MIPKTIHYVWVGDQPKSDLVNHCIESWRNKCPDYEIVEWNNARFASLDNEFAQQAFESRQWAFVSDYLRLHALHVCGGFYFDSDLEITADISQFRDLDFVSGYEKYAGRVLPVTALMGAVQGNKIISDLLEYYQSSQFVVDDDNGPVPNTMLIADYFLRRFGLSEPYDGAEVTLLSDREKLFPYYYFCTPAPGQKNFSIHHFSGSWKGGGKRRLLARIGSLSLLKIKKEEGVAWGELPLKAEERLLFQLPLGQRKRYCLIRNVERR